MQIRYVAILLLVLTPFSAEARPVSYPDGWMLMQMNDDRESSLMLSYSPTARDAFGVHEGVQRDADYWLHMLTYNRLLQRWNTKESQANIFLLTGLGAATSDTRSEVAASLGLEADWETRRLYVAYENNFLEAGRIDRSFSHKARFGVAPYLADYRDLHTWLMVQVEHRPNEGDAVIVTPFVRLFTQDVLGEIGISSRADPMLNFTFQF